MNKTESVGNVDEESITYIDNTAQLAYHYEETDKPYILALCMKDSNVEPVWWSLANIFDSDDYISGMQLCLMDDKGNQVCPNAIGDMRCDDEHYQEINLNGGAGITKILSGHDEETGLALLLASTDPNTNEEHVLWKGGDVSKLDTIHVFEEGDHWMGLYGSEDANGDIAGVGFIQYDDPDVEEEESQEVPTTVEAGDGADSGSLE